MLLYAKCVNFNLHYRIFSAQIQLFRYSSGFTWPVCYTKNERVTLESKWRKDFENYVDKWNERDLNEAKKFYCLSMFPYPSGKLHMGHVRVYTISDTFASYFRMKGYNVTHPMGWDAFGLPAENAAFDRSLDPKAWTDDNITYMKRQLKSLNLFFDWDRELSTCDPKYYKGTQQLFLWLMEEGLAYQDKAIVNWDPIDKTVLANEQVDGEGRSWRSGAVVEKKYLKQWFLRTTKFAKSLVDNLESIEENVGIKSMQKAWIGEISGCYFNLQINHDNLCEHMNFFCYHPAGIYGASHVVIPSECLSQLEDKLTKLNLNVNEIKAQFKQEKYIVLNNCYVINPFNGRILPIAVWNVEDENLEENHVNFIAIPSFNENDKNTAKHFGFEYTNILDEDGYMLNSDKISGMDVTKATEKILEISNKEKISDGCLTSSKLTDWLISRQRYWGTPIPVIHCPEHGAVPVPKKDLPVELPHISQLNLKPGKSPLESAESWVNTTCPICDGPAKRETDTMDTFVDSAWYFLRFLDPHNTELPFSKDVCKNMPVDLYIGGKEHAVLHLYFARFITHFLHSKKLLPSKEPFKKLLPQGIIKGQTFQLTLNKKYLHASEVDVSSDPNFVTLNKGEKVISSFEKMSKSKLNGVDPEEFVEQHGISMTRLFILYAASPHEDILWNVKTDVIPGMMRWQMRIWRIITKMHEARKNQEIIENVSLRESLIEDETRILRLTNNTIKHVTHHFEKDCVLSAAITSLMTLTKQLNKADEELFKHSKIIEKCVSSLLTMLFPFIPHFASHLWEGFLHLPYHLNEDKYKKNLFITSWPEQMDIATSDSTEHKIYVKVRNNVCGILMVDNPNMDHKDLTELALNLPRVSKKLLNLDITGIKCHTDKPIIDIFARKKGKKSKLSQTTNK